ncbi:glycosyl hydrolase [Cytophagales bacterium LB-30]|uniref:Glycosyl hydrolase n=1 Tax=Shiella aurantiaca TaxID=3058365 RepID=A0ABT8F6F9_9BACT|nr:glycosyl hydrolase [Shiella aurantiaca]MDN4165950.1 glycosyl hydrolase [Shiella aurantiaca]
MKNRLFLVALLLVGSGLGAHAQEASTAEQLQKAQENHLQKAKQSPLQAVGTREIGPMHQGARIVDIAVSSNPKTYYVAYASGGLFKTENKGITFQPVFDNQGALTIGDIALAPSNDQVIYVGTGESNSSRSSYAGSGVYKSTDAGKTWQWLGLAATQHTGAVVVHPTNPDVVWVGAVGALYTHNKERGVFKSTDGGKTWKHTLYINDSTGIIDLVINPANPNQLFAAAWERTRKAWNFKGSGEGSGIYVSNDGGETWAKTGEGFPSGKGVGRIGLDISPANPNIVYALLDNQEEGKVEKKDEEKKGLQASEIRAMSAEQFLAIEDAALDAYLKDNRYPAQYTAKKVKADVKAGEYTTKDIADFLGDANAALFETEVKGAEVYRSEDGGKTWKMMNEYRIDGVYYSYGYYFGRIRVSPTDANSIYILGVPLLMSENGGKTYTRIDSLGDVHVDHQAIWIDPADPAHVLLGNDGGLYESYDKGAYWNHINNMKVAQMYTLSVDMQKPYHVYSGLQDNGSMHGPSRARFDADQGDGWKDVYGGDGMFIFSDPRDTEVIYTGFQFGNYFRIDRNTGDYQYITPTRAIGEEPYRFNWRTPLLMSAFNPDILYMGAQKVFRSVDAGKTWSSISEDLTKNKPQGNVPFSTLSILEESPLAYGLLYAGSDDGNVYVTRNDGGAWELISKNLPADLWVSSIHPSNHAKGEVYVSLTGYRNDHFAPYIYKSTDYGQTWQSIVGDLPYEAVNVVIQDPVEPSLLYCGTDHGTYVSFNSGKNWDLITAIPNVASYEMLVHPRENELVVATHGRGVFIVDVKPMQALKGNTQQAIRAFEPATLRFSGNWGKQNTPYAPKNEPSVVLSYYVGLATASVKVDILNDKKEVVRSFTAPAAAGFNKVAWDVKVQELKNKKPTGKLNYAGKGTYTVRFTHGKVTSEVPLEIK